MITIRRRRISLWTTATWFMLMSLLVVPIVGQAQRQLRVVDIETLISVVGANVVSKDGVATTDSLGKVNVSDSCRTVSFSHVNYEPRIINLKEVGDTIYMISKLLNLKEVVVFGHGKSRNYEELKKRLKMEKTEAELASIDPGVALRLDLWKAVAAVLPKRWRPGYKKELRKKRLKEILENY